MLENRLESAPTVPRNDGSAKLGDQNSAYIKNSLPVAPVRYDSAVSTLRDSCWITHSTSGTRKYIRAWRPWKDLLVDMFGLVATPPMQWPDAFCRCSIFGQSFVLAPRLLVVVARSGSQFQLQPLFDATLCDLGQILNVRDRPISTIFSKQHPDTLAGKYCYLIATRVILQAILALSVTVFGMHCLPLLSRVTIRTLDKPLRFLCFCGAYGTACTLFDT